MPAYFKKNNAEILAQALAKITKNTPLSSVGVGSIVRAITEAFTNELGDLYDIMDFNSNQMLVSTATGSSLDALAKLYNIERKTISDVSILDRKLGSFSFFIDSPVSFDIVIPSGTNIYTDATSYIGRRFSYSTVESVTIPAGRTRAYASIKPNFTDSVYTAGVNTLILHDFTSPAAATVFCTNHKLISPQVAYEDDDNFRLRIIKNIRVSSGGTMEAVRFSGLSVAGVRDISIKQAPYGMGSFEVIVTPEAGGDPNQILTNAITSMNSVKPLGVRMFTKIPDLLVVNMSINVIMTGSNVMTLSENTLQRVRVGVVRYINSLLPGSTLVYNKLIQIALDSSDLVKDVILTSYNVGGQEILRKNYSPRYDQMLIPGTITVSMANS